MLLRRLPMRTSQTRQPKRLVLKLLLPLTLVSTVSGVLKGYDQLLNLVLDEAVEYLRGEIWTPPPCSCPAALC